MMRDVLRTIGIGCILAGGILYFTNNSKDIPNTEVQQLQDEVAELRDVLAKTKEELAIAQTTSSTEKNVSKDSKVDEKAEDDTTIPILTIKRGSNATFVASSLEGLGIIQDAAAFEAYLIENGLARKIQVGEHRLDSSMDFKTIAKKITTVKQK
ncbi:hypothetical protein [Sporosarcina sp. YIM B06819]|uniref:hypothetical protein n=1 Tax=Sporosarcina sp. YIM B06819 TaxID=3081769 RepID=UPI00298CA35B|nr:hypothetical protein [Sporosarcina sp. YIM B06819]